MHSVTPIYWTARTVTRIYYKAYHRWRIRYPEGPLPEQGPLLLVANHTSFLDPPLVACAMERPLRFMAKDTLFQKSKLFAWLIDALGAYPVRRDGADISSFKNSVKLLRDGEAVLIFPEGERSPDGELMEFAEGAARIATAVEGVQIVPVRIRGAFQAWPRHKRLPRPKRVEVAFGKAWGLDELKAANPDKKGLYRAVAASMFRSISNL